MVTTKAVGQQWCGEWGRVFCLFVLVWSSVSNNEVEEEKAIYGHL